MTRKHLIAGNWKMNETIPEAVVLAQEISNLMERDWLEMGVTPASMRARALRFTSSLVSPKIFRRSEWPTMQ